MKNQPWLLYGFIAGVLFFFAAMFSYFVISGCSVTTGYYPIDIIRCTQELITP